MKNNHSKDWYFAAASANHVYATYSYWEVSNEETDSFVGAEKGSRCELRKEAEYVIEDTCESSIQNHGFILCQYGLEKAGLA